MLFFFENKYKVKPHRIENTQICVEYSVKMYFVNIKLTLTKMLH